MVEPWHSDCLVPTLSHHLETPKIFGLLSLGIVICVVSRVYTVLYIKLDEDMSSSCNIWVVRIR